MNKSVLSIALIALPSIVAKADAIDCYKKAREMRPAFMPNEAARLCAGATSDAPVACATKASNIKGHGFPSKDAVTLCAGATSDAPVSCAQKAYEIKYHGLSYGPAAALCAGATSNAPIVCAQQAMNLTPSALSEQQSVNLCAGAKSDAAIICVKKAIAITGSNNLEPDDAVALCAGIKQAGRSSSNRFQDDDASTDSKFNH